MRLSKVLSKWRAGKTARICALSNYLPHFPRLAASAGFDGVWVDGEHKPFDPRQAQALLGFHRLADIDCVWRPPTKEKNALYRLLEDGASGLLIPHVNSADEARLLVQSVKFPPLGDRGVDGAALDADFSLDGEWSEYPEAANRETFLLVQIETPEALERAEEIASVPGVEGLFLGVGDMAFRLGCTPSAMDPAIIAVQRRIQDVVHKHGKIWGQPVASIDDAQRVLEIGARLLVHGGDFGMVKSGLCRCGSELDALLGDG